MRYRLKIWQSQTGHRPQNNIVHVLSMLDNKHYRHTQSYYVILIASPGQHWLRDSASLLRHMYIACLVQHKHIL